MQLGKIQLEEMQHLNNSPFGEIQLSFFIN